MKPSFADAVDPIFLHVLGVLDRIAENKAPDATTERELIHNKFRDAEAKLGERQDWQLSKYALTAWIDDVLTDAPWPGREWWENNSLEFEYYKTRERATVFYSKAKEAGSMTSRDALEVFYLCVVLGFRGLYRDQDAAFLASQLELPVDLETWAKQSGQSIQLGQGRPPIEVASRPGSGAPPLEGRFLFIGMSLVGIILAALTAITAWSIFWPES